MSKKKFRKSEITKGKVVEEKYEVKQTEEFKKAEKLFGILLKTIRDNGEMFVYTALSKLLSFKIDNKCFVLETDDDTIFKTLNSNLGTISQILTENGYETKLCQLENKLETLQNKLITEFGDKLKIQE